MTFSKLLAATALWTLLIPPSHAQANDPFANHRYDGKCGAPVRSADDAMLKADFVIEGTVSNIVVMGGADRAVELVIEKSKVIREWEPSNSGGKTLVVRLGPCFAQGLQAFQGAAGAKLEGQRVRLFGNQHIAGPTKRFFYLQPASSPIPVAAKTGTPWSGKGFAPKIHRKDASAPLGDGWHLAKSTEGGFSVELPGVFQDLTTAQYGNGEFRLVSKDQFGSTYVVTFEPSVPDAELIGTFDNAMSEPGARIAQFKGMPAVSGREIIDTPSGKMAAHSMLFRVPGGTYLLGIAASEKNESKSLRLRERFYNSIRFE